MVQDKKKQSDESGKRLTRVWSGLPAQSRCEDRWSWAEGDVPALPWVWVGALEDPQKSRGFAAAGPADEAKEES